MKRREFITLLGGATAASWPLVARAQQQDRMRRIGVLSNLPENDPQMKARLSAFLQGLEKRGWSQGRNVQIRDGLVQPLQINCKHTQKNWSHSNRMSFLQMPLVS